MDVMLQNAMLHSVEGDFILFDKIPVWVIELFNRRFKTFPVREAYLNVVSVLE